MLASFNLDRLERRSGRVRATVLVLCTASAVGAIALAWWGFRPAGAVASVIQIDFSSGSLVSNDPPPSGEYLKRLKNNHRSLVKSPLVLEQALRRRAIAQLDLVQGHGEHALEWLQDAITVYFLEAGTGSPADHEVMELRLGGLREHELQDGVAVVHEIVQVYMDVAVLRGRLTDNARREDLQSALESLHDGLKQSLGKLEKLKANSGGDPTAAVTIMLLEDEIHARRGIAKQLQAKVVLQQLGQRIRDHRSGQEGPSELIRIVQPAMSVTE